MTPFFISLPSTEATETKPRVMSEKYSAGPKSKAISAILGAKKTSNVVPINAAIKEPIAAVDKASAALPFFAIRFP